MYHGKTIAPPTDPNLLFDTRRDLDDFDVLDPAEMEKFQATANLFREYADKYDFDWLMLIAQAFQESRLGADTKNSHGAVGIMQIKPASAAEAGIDDISTDDGNIEGGAAYLRLLIDHYFDDAAVDPTTKQIFAIAGYNAGPTRIRNLRRKTAAAGLDPNKWFDNVEVLVAREVGRETVRYVSNIMKYYVTFTLMIEEAAIEEAREP